MTGRSGHGSCCSGCFPALFVGGDALSQLWVFMLAPLVGAVIAALVSRYLFPTEGLAPEDTANKEIPSK